MLVSNAPTTPMSFNFQTGLMKIKKPSVTFSEAIGLWGKDDLKKWDVISTVISPFKSRSWGDWLLIDDHRSATSSTAGELLLTDFVNTLRIPTLATWHPAGNDYIDPIDTPTLVRLVEHISIASPALKQNIEELHLLTGMSQSDLADQLIGVSRQSLSAWLGGTRQIRRKNHEKIVEIVSILRIASRRRPSAFEMREWLFTPTTSRAVRPLDLLRTGQFDEARMLATSSLPFSRRPLDRSIMEGRDDPWSSRNERARTAFLSDERASDFKPESDE